MKKIIYIGIILLCTTTLFAQGREVDREFKAQINPIFDKIDKRQVPHGILLDYAMEFTNVPAPRSFLFILEALRMSLTSQL